MGFSIKGACWDRSFGGVAVCWGNDGLQQNSGAGLEIKPQKLCLWFRELFKASKAAAGEKGKQMYF